MDSVSNRPRRCRRTTAGLYLRRRPRGREVTPGGAYDRGYDAGFADGESEADRRWEEDLRRLLASLGLRDDELGRSGA